MKKILLTGANGLVGKAILSSYDESRFSYIAAVRKPVAVDQLPSCNKVITIEALDSHQDWQQALIGIDVVVHTAARVHVMDDHAENPIESYRKVNVEGTLNLAKQSAENGVKRFIFLSSIKVNGEYTNKGEVFFADDLPNPQDPYSVSKLEAEQGLKKIAKNTGLEVVIIRPPLVYGPGVKANFALMMKLVEKKFPLPLGAVCNKRSMVGIDNLIDLIESCIDHPAAAGQIFLAGDGDDLSTTELLKRLAVGANKKSYLIPVPPFILYACARLIGKADIARRVLGSLQVDISKTRKVLNWIPPVSVNEGLSRCFVDKKMNRV